MTRDALVGAILAFLAGQELLTLDDIRRALEREIDEAGPEAVLCLRERLAAETDWVYYPPDPLARRIHRVLADRLLEPESALHGVDRAVSVAGRPVAVFANHLSYADANLLEILLQRSGGASLAERLTAIAGPKVYSSTNRRFSSLCFGTIKVPQSTGRSSEEAVMSARDVARAARRSIDAATERLALGDALLLFAEGARSRTREMQQMLVGVARYLEVPGVRVLPVGIVGTEALFPVGDVALHPARIVVRIGEPFDAKTLEHAAAGDRRVMIDAIGLAIAELLPVEYRGVYGEFVAGLDEARRVLAAVRATA